MSKRRHFSPEEKAAAVKRLVLQGEPASSICEDLKIHPNVLTDWKRVFFANAEKAFERKSNTVEKRLEKKVTELESKVSNKDRVIATLTEMNLDLKKKTLGRIELSSY